MGGNPSGTDVLQKQHFANAKTIVSKEEEFPRRKGTH